ncbi:MAG: methionine adenosyltransferase [Thiobacillaceae bacterium]|nr:methionine adenosyltransferase [Thiobacillaceae bacterium]MCX7673729.1 methionine adenosyltransferase [Thiobacillaceae bacterium]MDW8322960.1 methionine adenosyltransferase [Burkholderiales bacterium]
MKTHYMFTSESVTEGHPDKLCDQIADAVVDRFLRQDPMSRVLAECAVANGVLFIAARFASTATVDIPEVARSIIRQVGYAGEDFNAEACTVMTNLSELPFVVQRDERELDEDELERIPARNMANAFGFACDETAALMPLPIWLAHKLARRLAAVRLQRQLPYLAPDGKTQVGVEYRDGRPHRIHSITLVASQQRALQVSERRLRDDLYAHVIEPVFLDEPLRPDRATAIFVNPDGPFVNGGPASHSGLTGRKNAVDTYGEYSRQSESALSGKDPTRIDRVGAYAARHAAKNAVAAGLARRCEVQLTYTIGQAQPVSVQVDTHGTGVLADEVLAERIKAQFDFRPAGIIRAYELRHLPARHRGGFYHRLAAYGQVGRMDLGLPWERTDKVEALRG